MNPTAASCSDTEHVFKFKSWCCSAPISLYGQGREIPIGWPCLCGKTRLSRELTTGGMVTRAVPCDQWVPRKTVGTVNVHELQRHSVMYDTQAGTFMESDPHGPWVRVETLVPMKSVKTHLPTQGQFVCLYDERGDFTGLGRLGSFVDESGVAIMDWLDAYGDRVSPAFWSEILHR